MSTSPFIDKLNKLGKGPATDITVNPKETSQTSTMPAQTATATLEDDRGFQKTENYVMMNPKDANFQDSGMLSSVGIAEC